MTNYVMVHGGNMSTETWNRLTIGPLVKTPDGRMGGMIWEPLFPALRAAGHQLFNPTLQNEKVADLSANIAQIGALITGQDLRKVVLVGHSFGGMVITGLSAQMPERIVHLVYVDAALPDPGQSLFDIIRSTGTDPLSFPGLEADPPFVEKLNYDRAKFEPLPKMYIRCTKSDFAVVTMAAKKKIDADPGKWAYYELPSSHVPMAEMPERLSPILLEAAK